MLKIKALMVVSLVFLSDGLEAKERISILCKAQEHWTFVEEVGHPQNWSFSLTFSEAFGQIEILKLSGVACEKLSKAYATNERIGFVCESNISSQMHQKFSFFINRLNADFLILKEYPYRPRLDGPTIGVCALGEKHF